MASILYKDIQIESEIRFARITGLRVEEKINEHAAAYISGVLHEKTSLQEAYGLNFKSNFKIKATEDSKEKTIFSGIPVNVEIKSLSGVNYINIYLKSHSFKLDIKKISRSFQDFNNPYESLFTQIIKTEHKGSVFDTASKSKKQDNLITQYEETDWQFVKRLASQLNAVIHPFMEEDKPQVYIGCPKGDSYIETIPQFELEKAIGGYIESASNFAGWAVLDFVTDTIESGRIYRLCDKVKYNEVTFMISERISELRQGVLINLYKLKPEGGFKQNTFYNEKFTGLSIDGKVINIDKDKMKIHLCIDKEQSEDKACWFEFNTPYVTEGNNGIYFMPEKDNSVKIYFPKNDESCAYIRSVNRADGEKNPKTKEPDTKYFETVNGKELKMSPDSLCLTAKHGKVHMFMTEEGGIEFKSNEDIVINCPEITLRGKTVNIKAGDKMSLRSNSSSVLISSVIDMKGVGDVDFC